MPKTSSSPLKETKSAAIRRLLGRKSGATLPHLQKATGWQPHLVRAVLSTLRRKGFAIDKLPPKSEGGAPVYRISGAPERP